jgi:hypothetical protein
MKTGGICDPTCPENDPILTAELPLESVAL